jgi:protein tyrosine phosphatase (PTP) superfamily phosphohydrolase (DUF442 family)
MMRIALTCTIALSLFGCAGNESNDLDDVENSASAGALGESSPEPINAVPLLPDGPTEADYPHLHNLLQVTDRIYSGGEPKDDQAFEELATLGVRTLVSVDGARPNLDAAQRHGLRYVHIPIGYDGISDEAGRSLARLVKEAEGPFYIHCHHGVHRGPAAAAVACIADGKADGSAALTILEKARTSKGYAGLWRDLESYRAPAPDEDLPELVSVAEVGSLVAAMALIDRASDDLKLCQAADWQAPSDHPDLAPAQAALLLNEGFRETVRQLDGSNDTDEQFAAWMKEAEESAAALEAALAVTAIDRAAAHQAFGVVQAQCQRCHSAYRD